MTSLPAPRLARGVDLIDYHSIRLDPGVGTAAEKGARRGLPIRA